MTAAGVPCSSGHQCDGTVIVQLLRTLSFICHFDLRSSLFAFSVFCVWVSVSLFAFSLSPSLSPSFYLLLFSLLLLLLLLLLSQRTRFIIALTHIFVSQGTCAFSDSLNAGLVWLAQSWQTCTCGQSQLRDVACQVSLVCRFVILDLLNLSACGLKCIRAVVFAYDEPVRPPRIQSY